MRFVVGFFRFWWDFVIGDDWRIAAGVGVVLAAGALLVSSSHLSDGVISLAVGSGILVVATASIVGSALSARRRSS